MLRGISYIASDLGLSDSVGGRLLGEALTLGQALERDGRSIPSRLLGIVAELVDPILGKVAADTLFVALAALSVAPKWGDETWIGTRWPRGAVQPGWTDARPDTEDKKILIENRAALALLVSQAAFIEQCRHLSSYQPISSSDAAIRRDRLAASFDDLVERSGAALEEPLFSALTRVALGASSALNLASETADLILLRLTTPAPAIVLAYDRYEDPPRAQEIIARNNIVHPLALPTDRDLELLIR